MLPTRTLFFLFSFAQCRPGTSLSLQDQRRNPRSLWGSFNDALVEGITVDDIGKTNVATTFDFVIVGGGPGGLTLAMRLTEDPNVRVAVVEKGTLSKASFTFQLGELATSTFVDPTNPALMPSIDYIDITEPIKANGYRQHYPQGKMLGGSSARGFSA